LDKNATFQLKMTDNGLFSPRDTLAVSVWNNSGGLWFASNWDGTKAAEQSLAAGNLIVVSTTLKSLAASNDGPASDSIPVELSIQKDSLGARVQFAAHPGFTYAIEYSADLVNWTASTEVIGDPTDDEILTLREQTSAESARFYRIRARQTGERR
jgi:hypothetical protein